MRIINRNETITGAKLSVEIRSVRFTGGSGEISFDANGDRPGYSGILYTVHIHVHVHVHVHIIADYLCIIF